eukprot:UN03480
MGIMYHNVVYLTFVVNIKQIEEFYYYYYYYWIFFISIQLIAMKRSWFYHSSLL